MEKLENQAIKLIGLQLNHKTSNENGQSSIDCGNLWQHFEKGKISESIPQKLTNSIYAVYFNYEGDHTQPFSYFIGCLVASSATTPEGLNSLIIPPQKYSKIIAKGKMPDCMAEAWKSIWSSEINRAYSYDFEVYDHRSHDWSNAEVDVFVAIK